MYGTTRVKTEGKFRARLRISNSFDTGNNENSYHLMCQTCYDSLSGNGKKYVPRGTDCQVDSKPGLSLFVANVLKELPTQCKFTPNGCQVIIVLKNLEVHEVDCVYRIITCPFIWCRTMKDEPVTFIGLGEHLEAKHKDLRKIGKSKSKDFISSMEVNEWLPLS
jgi:hypothetical protein